MPRVMTINQAAQHLAVCPDTIRRHVRMGLLPAQRKARGTRFQWMVEVPDSPPVEPSPSDSSQPAGHTSPSAEEYRRMTELVDELRRMLTLATAELDARRQEVKQLLALLERAQTSPAATSNR